MGYGIGIWPYFILLFLGTGFNIFNIKEKQKVKLLAYVSVTCVTKILRQLLLLLLYVELIL